MVLKCMQFFAILLSLSFLGAVLLSFLFAKFPDATQKPDRFTGYPTWHGEVKGYNPDQHDSINLLSVVLMIISIIIGMKSINSPPRNRKLITHFCTVSDDSDRNEIAVPALGFNRLLVLYNVATLFTVGVAILIDVGKLFSVIGIFHNSVEISILTLIGGGGKIKSGSFLAWMLFYVLSTSFLVIYVPFPNDAAFFKFQGLIMDFALVIEFIRVYITTKEHIRDAGREVLPPLNVEEEDDDNNDKETGILWPLQPATVEYPRHLLVLLLASIIHLIGNILNTFFFAYAKPLLLFEFSYTTTFPIYIYFVYKDTQASSVLLQKRIYIPNTPPWKAAVIAISSITLSLLTIRISFIFANMEF